MSDEYIFLDMMKTDSRNPIPKKTISFHNWTSIEFWKSRKCRNTAWRVSLLLIFVSSRIPWFPITLAKIILSGHGAIVIVRLKCSSSILFHPARANIELSDFKRGIWETEFKIRRRCNVSISNFIFS